MRLNLTWFKRENQKQNKQQEGRFIAEMRDIEFRGLVVDEPYTWIYGYLMSENIIHQIKEPKFGCCGVGTFQVIPESIGQYTGCRDKHNIKIFENDLVKDFEAGYCFKVKYEDGAFLLEDEDMKLTYLLLSYPLDKLEVIGNSFTLKEDNYEYELEGIYRMLRCLL